MFSVQLQTNKNTKAPLERLFELSYKKCTAYVMETLRFDRRDIKKEKICVSIHHVYLTYPDYIW